MPGFPLSSSSKIMLGLFSAPQSAGSTDLNLRMYTSATTGGNGLFPKATKLNPTATGDAATGTAAFTAPTGQVAANTAGDAVDLYIGLIKGTNAAIFDDNFNANGVIGPGAASPANAGIGEADYSGYKRVRITSTPGTAGTGAANSTFSAITSSGSGGVQLSSISIVPQLQFPANQTGAGGANSGAATNNTIIGFFISTNPRTQAQDSPTTNMIDIIAYGALSSTRSITANDTPVFTGGAITITLD